MASQSLAGALTIAQGSVVATGNGVFPSFTGTFNLSETESPAKAAGGFPMSVTGTTDLPLGSITTVSMLYIKVTSGSLVIHLSSGAGGDQVIPQSVGQLYQSGTAYTAIQVVGTATIEYAVCGS